MSFLPHLPLILVLLLPGCTPAMERTPVIRLGGTDRADGSLIQVGIVPSTQHAELRPEGSYSVIDEKTGESHDLEDQRDYMLQTKNAGYLLGPYEFQGPTRLSPRHPGDLFRVKGKKYRGSLLVKPNQDGTLAIVNELGIEEYLYGVLPAEMSPEWPLDALKAQAVVARTFALNNLGKFQSSGYDFSNDSRSQAFTDVEKESPRVLKAVQATRGEVLAWKGGLLKAFFHSCCGGHTADYGSVWGTHNAPPPLRGVSDRYCKYSPQYQWSAYFTEDDILAALQKHGHDTTKIRNIRIRSHDNTGFAHILRFSTKEGGFDVRAGDFRDWMGNTELKSTKIIRIGKKHNGYEFLGRGYGHGVGLCQWGSNAMAGSGKNYRQILRYYFPGAKLARYE